MKQFDVVGVGLNATDTMIVIPRMPAYGGKVPFLGDVLSPGGQVASAIVCCSMLGLKSKYIGTIGDDERGEIQMQSLLGTGVNLDHVQRRKGCPNQSAYILIDQTTGERTVFWSRPDGLKIDPNEITEDQITCANLLHIDGHDTAAVAHALGGRVFGDEEMQNLGHRSRRHVRLEHLAYFADLIAGFLAR
ncbi:MAG TPA: carbohydrate kinase family protein, partial [Bryobacteraceae bacterium]|nr:carbohydrate kinase family protein [Bryobacteraceae bacterium]